MALILISGYPSSGKTYRSHQMVNFFHSRIESSLDPRIKRLTVTHISDHSLGLSRDAYTEARKEKDARAAYYSAVKQKLGRGNVVIADGMNYIKGYRYQLYCEAKAVQTPSCVVHIGTSITKCQELNARSLESCGSDCGYPPDLLKDLIYRYEEPNGMTRWDSPLFTVPYDDDAPPCDTMWEEMIGSEGKAKIVKPNQATVQKPPTESDYLYILDNTTQEVLNVIQEYQKNHPGESGGRVDIPISDTESNDLELPASNVTLPLLQRIRRAFITLNRQHSLPKDRIRSTFVQYLDDNLG